MTADLDHDIATEPGSLDELHRSLVRSLSGFASKKSRSIGISRTSRKELVVRARVDALKLEKLAITVTPDSLSFRKDSPSKILTVDLKGFLHSTSHRRGYFEVKIAPERSTAELKPAATKRPADAVYAASRVLNTAVKPLQTIFVTRALNALTHLSEDMGEAPLAAANAAPSDLAVLIRALETPEIVEKLRKQDPLLPARLRGIAAKQSLLEGEGGSLGVEQVARLLSISRQAVDKRRRLGRLLAVSLGKRGYAYPAWQFTEGGVLPGLETILRALRAHDPWMQIAFMLNANTRLAGRRPLDALRSGQTEAVLKAARAYGEQGAA